jgi:hypothetical protein
MPWVALRIGIFPLIGVLALTGCQEQEPAQVAVAPLNQSQSEVRIRTGNDLPKDELIRSLYKNLRARDEEVSRYRAEVAAWKEKYDKLAKVEPAERLIPFDSLPYSKKASPSGELAALIDEVGDAFLRLSRAQDDVEDASEELEDAVRAFAFENWRDVVPRLSGASEDLSSSISDLDFARTRLKNAISELESAGP